MLRSSQFPHAARSSSILVRETVHDILQICNVFVDLNCSQVGECTLTDGGVFGGLVGSAPEDASSDNIAAIFGHAGCQHLHGGMGIRCERSALEYFRGVPVILKFCVINEAQIVIEPPVIRIVGDAILHELDSALRLARTLRGSRSQKSSAEFVGGD